MSNYVYQSVALCTLEIGATRRYIARAFETGRGQRYREGKYKQNGVITLLNQFDIWEYAPYAFDVEDHDYQLGVNLSEYEPYAFDDDDYGYLLGIVLLERRQAAETDTKRYVRKQSSCKYSAWISTGRFCGLP